MHSQKSTGVTLIELLMAIAIIAVISSIAIPLYSGYISTARNAEGWNNLAAIKMAEEEFFLENNTYFFGANTAALESNSGNLWTVSGSDSGINFNYAVAQSGGGYVATATGLGAGSKVPDTVTLSVVH